MHQTLLMTSVSIHINIYLLSWPLHTNIAVTHMPCYTDLNVLDWSKGNQLAVALGNTVHVYSVSTGRTTELCKSEEQSVSPTALQWSPNANHIAIGMSDAEIQVSLSIVTVRLHGDR